MFPNMYDLHTVAFAVLFLKQACPRNTHVQENDGYKEEEQEWE